MQRAPNSAWLLAVLVLVVVSSCRPRPRYQPRLPKTPEVSLALLPMPAEDTQDTDRRLSGILGGWHGLRLTSRSRVLAALGRAGVETIALESRYPSGPWSRDQRQVIQTACSIGSNLGVDAIVFGRGSNKARPNLECKRYKLSFSKNEPECARYVRRGNTATDSAYLYLIYPKLECGMRILVLGGSLSTKTGDSSWLAGQAFEDDSRREIPDAVRMGPDTWPLKNPNR